MAYSLEVPYLSMVHSPKCIIFLFYAPRRSDNRGGVSQDMADDSQSSRIWLMTVNPTHAGDYYTKWYHGVLRSIVRPAPLGANKNQTKQIKPEL